MSLIVDSILFVEFLNNMGLLKSFGYNLRVSSGRLEEFNTLKNDEKKRAYIHTPLRSHLKKLLFL